MMDSTMRYQIVYGKGDFPLIAWKPNMNDARTLAESLRKAGYHYVAIWEYSKRGVREIKF